MNVEPSTDSKVSKTRWFALAASDVDSLSSELEKDNLASLVSSILNHTLPGAARLEVGNRHGPGGFLDSFCFATAEIEQGDQDLTLFPRIEACKAGGRLAYAMLVVTRNFQFTHRVAIADGQVMR